MVLTSMKSFEKLSETTGYQVDQIRFFAGMVASLFLAVLYNIFLSPEKAVQRTRLGVGLLWGIALGWLCYPSNFLQLIILPSVCYVVICTVSHQVVHRYIFILALSWLSINHIYRQVTDYGSYKLDITGPLMLITLRVTYVGYALHDGLGRDPLELTKEQKTHSLKKIPSFLEFFSYILHFSSLLAGPSCTFFEYMEFINGVDMKRKYEDKDHKEYIQFPIMTVIRKTVLAFVCLGGVFLFDSRFSVETCVDPEFMSSTSLMTKLLFSYGVIFVRKLRYYFAWTFAEAINNAAGMGFNGYDEDGNALWDKYTSCKKKNIEFATNCRMIIANWNIPTVKWLKRTVHDRTEHHRVLATFVVSALWHGFYPGYYLCFVSVGLITLSARMTRRSFRAYFQESRAKQILYDILTWLVTIVLVLYNCVAFVMLDFQSGLIYWRSVYYLGHVLTLLGFASPWISNFLGMKRAAAVKGGENKINEVKGPKQD